MALVCITGASSGIGREFALQLSRRGMELILVARSEEKLKEVAAACPGKATVFSCDLSKTGECRRLLTFLETRPVSLFINNAGFGAVGLFDEGDLSRDLAMIDVNVRAMHILTYGMVKQMKARNRGHILNTASVAGLTPGGPMMASYYATKAYVVSLTNAVAEELRHEKSRVTIHALCPGPVNTNFNHTAGVRFALPGISARECVSAAVKGMKKGQVVIVPRLSVRAGALCAKLLPRSTVLPVLFHMQKKKTEA